MPIRHACLTIEAKSLSPFFKIGITYYYLPLNLKFDKWRIANALIPGSAELVSFVNVFIAILAKSGLWLL